MERLLQDARFAARVLWRDRGFATTATLTLAMCIGANAAIFAIVNAILLRPLPTPHAEQLVYMYNAYPGAGVTEGGSSGVPDYYDRLRETDVFQEQALYNTRGVTLGQEGNPQRVTAMLATPSLLRLLQTQAVRGRLFTEEDGEIGKTHKVVLTYATWQQSFGGRDDAIGRDMRINSAPLMLVRSSARMKEIATRHALGAGLGRIARQLLTETVILTLAGGVGGLAIGWTSVRTLATFGLDRTPQGTHLALNVQVIAFTLVVAVLVGLVIGSVAVLGSRQLNLSHAFREEGRSGTASRGSRRVGRALVTAQVAFAFMLLIGAGLLLASFQRVLAVRPGFDTAHVLTGTVSPPASRYKGNPELIAFTNRLLDRVRALPGVQAAGVTSVLPLGGNFNDSVILAEGYVMSPGESLISPCKTSVSPGYFEAMGIPLKRGRLFVASDDERAPKVTVIDERLAMRFFGRKDPIGRRLWQPDKADELTRGPGPTSRFCTIVGVVGNIRTRGLTEKEPVGAYYFPVAQDTIRTMTLVARAAGDPDTLTQAIRREVTAIDPELPFYGARSMRERVSQSLLSRRTPMLLAVLFAAVALFLASIGIYGVLAYQVAQRRREIGIRLALGSDGARIFRLVVREGLMLLAIGVAAGFAGSVAIRRAMASQLFGVQPLDPIVLTSVAALLGVVAFTACAVPARRAARIDPLIALTDQ